MAIFGRPKVALVVTDVEQREWVQLGEMPLCYFFAFIGAHEARHAAQLREIAAVFSSAGPFSAGSRDRAALS